MVWIPVQRLVSTIDIMKMGKGQKQTNNMVVSFCLHLYVYTFHLDFTIISI